MTEELVYSTLTSYIHSKSRHGVKLPRSFHRCQVFDTASVILRVPATTVYALRPHAQFTSGASYPKPWEMLKYEDMPYMIALSLLRTSNVSCEYATDAKVNLNITRFKNRFNQHHVYVTL